LASVGVPVGDTVGITEVGITVEEITADITAEDITVEEITADITAEVITAVDITIITVIIITTIIIILQLLNIPKKFVKIISRIRIKENQETLSGDHWLITEELTG